MRYLKLSLHLNILPKKKVVSCIKTLIVNPTCKKFILELHPKVISMLLPQRAVIVVENVSG